MPNPSFGEMNEQGPAGPRDPPGGVLRNRAETPHIKVNEWGTDESSEFGRMSDPSRASTGGAEDNRIAGKMLDDYNTSGDGVAAGTVRHWSD